MCCFRDILTSAPVSISNSIGLPFIDTTIDHGFPFLLLVTTPKNASLLVDPVSAFACTDLQTDWKCPLLPHLWQETSLAGHCCLLCFGDFPHQPQVVDFFFRLHLPSVKAGLKALPVNIDQFAVNLWCSLFSTEPEVILKHCPT